MCRPPRHEPPALRSGMPGCAMRVGYRRCRSLSWAADVFLRDVPPLVAKDGPITTKHGQTQKWSEAGARCKAKIMEDRGKGQCVPTHAHSPRHTRAPLFLTPTPTFVTPRLYPSGFPRSACVCAGASTHPPSSMMRPTSSLWMRMATSSTLRRSRASRGYPQRTSASRQANTRSRASPKPAQSQPEASSKLARS